MNTLRGHPYHLVTFSPWPLLISLAAFTTAVGGVMYMHFFSGGLFILLLGLFNVVLVMGLWWRDVIREATFEGHHTLKVQQGLRLGFILFIISEVMFFFGFFWAFFHSALSPAISIGCIWPPLGITPFDPLGIPAVNTYILLLSGATITAAHFSLGAGKYLPTWRAMVATETLAIIFTYLQLWEYTTAPFSISDGIYGSVFYMITGLHGFHVIIGTLFILVCSTRLERGHFTTTHHLGFEFAAWYWHFVDVVWLFVYLSIYWWGGK